MNEEMLKPSEVCARLNISRTHAYTMIAERVIPSVRIGGAIRVPRGDFEAWLETLRAEGAAKRC